MTSGFLNAIAAYYYKNAKDELADYCFVFPSQRAGIFFTNHLRQLVDGPAWAPEILTVNDFFASLSKAIPADNITLLFTLHQVYNEVTKKAISFDEFLAWGELFLGDFDDIDKYLVEVDQLFSNLIAFKELDDDYSHLNEKQLEAIKTFWGTFKAEQLSSHQSHFLENWEHIPHIYKAFVRQLQTDSLAYEGMIYREVADKIIKDKLIDIKWKKVVFVGLNALTPAERKLMDNLRKRQLADFFWDYSPWMETAADDVFQSRGPGLFLNENRLRYPAPKDFVLPLNEQGPEVTITAVANPTEQLKSVHAFLTKEYESDLKTAVVLADETMLMPTLHGIPNNVDRVNVTMGYPLNNTPVFGLVNLLFDLQRNARTSKEGTWLYHRHVLPILQHQYISLLAEDDCRSMHKKLVKENIIFVRATELHSNALFKLLFSRVNNGSELADYLINILTKIYELLQPKEDKLLEQEFVYALHKSIVRLQDLLEQNQQHDLLPETWIKLFKKLADFQTVPFKGEPLAGLQVMGILETRALDFDKLIILDLNEGVFPRTSAPNTFIPATLRAGFELPTIEFQDAIFSYYFFRLIHRAKKVELLYSTGAQGMKSNEMSRYLYQLKYEFNAHINTHTTSENVSLLDAPQPIARKTAAILGELDKYKTGHQRFLSPSALSVYIECPMRFYYQKIANISEPEEITEEADARIFGLIFHDVVEHLYKPFEGQEIEAATIEGWIKNKKRIDELIRDGFNKHLSDYEKGKNAFTEIHGKNVMVFEVIRRYLLQFLKLEKARAPFTIVELERKVEHNYACNGLQLNIGGYIDRLESKDGLLRVMDYKTGTGDATAGSIEDLFNTDKHKKIKATFQTLLYSLILDETADEPTPIQPGVIWVRDVFKKSYDTQLFLKDGRSKNPILLQSVQSEFKAGLDSLLAELYNPDIPFQQVEDITKCRFCPYKTLCNR
ncbi:PD-(D/E)XK nuclease family protein [Carboxylicivirga sediminis]|uniref:PD-(D/E)XK nuclease family protein n=1 Tax=Carboxylicivirga sediminis TaxID=2006564 RepID=A0A941FCS2_9BACT|nr:PD-(D/E)XK nuclease family protein [Carboxylicivirga sediminis]MBR8538354.1 PD-(D/E)XK nuclease family protein [Carboxylicivirga sediminis]